MPKKLNLLGQTYGRLTVIEEAPGTTTPGGHKKVRWKCKCECGNIVIVDANCLRTGNTKSCGCYSKDITRQVIAKKHPAKKDFNKYIIKDNIAYIQLGKNTTMVDANMLNKIKHLHWRLDKSGYAVSKENYKAIRLHRLIMNVNNPKIFIDHINHNKLDNRKENLRFATLQQNTFNTRKRSENREYKGVHNVGKKWRADIKFKNKNISLGIFNTPEEAAKAYDAKAKELQGEFACLNFPD